MAKKKKKPMRLPSTSRVGRVQKDLEVFDSMKRRIASMDPETIIHVGEQLVMTEAQLQSEIAEQTEMLRAIGLEGKGAESQDVYNTFRAVNGLDHIMTARDFLAMLEARTMRPYY